MMKKNIIKCLFWILEGILVGFGAIMPGISGGTLCVAFGVYLPIIEVLSHPFKKLKEHFRLLLFFGIGGIIGFVGLSKLAAYLMELSSNLVTCAFVGFILGTVPELWQGAGEKGRKKTSIWYTAGGFAVMLALLLFLQSGEGFIIKPDVWGFVICGVLWGLSFIVPGLSSSTLLLFFGLYQPMLDGIGSLDFKVLIPLAIGMALCVLLLSKVVNKGYERFYTRLSHIILGVVISTAVMIIPFGYFKGISIVYGITCIVLGGIVSYALTMICNKLKK